MKVIVLSMMGVVGLAACGVTDTENVGETSQQINYGNDIFYDKFDSYAVGDVVGQGGWVLPPGAEHSCVVVPGLAPDKNLACSWDGTQNGQGAMHTFFRPLHRNYHFQFDVWMHDVTDATHGKVFLEDAPGTGQLAIFQIATGCDFGPSGVRQAGIRVTFEYAGPTAVLLTDMNCDGHYRVACIWHDEGTQLRCGASRLPLDPVEANFQLINTGEPIGKFSLVRVLGGIGPRLGTTVFDKVQVLSD